MSAPRLPSHWFRRALALEPHDEHQTPRRFRASRTAPFAIRWYGATSLYGHFRNFISRAIAAEAVDSRDWMRPQPPEVLLERVAGVLGAKGHGATLLERLGRPVWIDFVADTGDDRDASAAVAAMLARTYKVPGKRGTQKTLPRGEILLFGGDTAYPVATADELHRRLVEPWNSVFRQARRARPGRRRRVLMGVPGNHDWYDGLDGYGRLFRRSPHAPTADLGSGQAPRKPPKRRGLMRRLGSLGHKNLGDQVQSAVGSLSHKLHLDEVSGTLRIFGSIYRSLHALFTGRTKKRRRRLVLLGYNAVQEASYFALPLAPGLDLWGVDRQLGQLDYRQRTYFRQLRAQRSHNALLLCASDPFSAYGEPNQAGVQILERLGLSTERDRMLYVTGDYHHYERRRFGADVTQVIAGGGGAFLHGTRINQFSLSRVGLHEDERRIPRAARAYPSAKISRRLLRGVPTKLLGGRAGYLVHLAAALASYVQFDAYARGAWVFSFTTVGFAVSVIGLLYFIAGHGSAHPRFIAAVAVPFGVGLGLVPALCLLALGPWLAVVPPLAAMAVLVIASSLLIVLGFSLFLCTVAILGLEHQQAFTVLGHTGFKHFVRLRVAPSGQVDAFVIGKDDPQDDSEPRLLDRFRVQLSPREPSPESLPPRSLRVRTPRPGQALPSVPAPGLAEPVPNSTKATPEAGDR